MVIRLGVFGGLSEVHRCLSCFPAHHSISEDCVSLHMFSQVNFKLSSP